MNGMANAGSEIEIPHPKPAIIWNPYIRAGTATAFGNVLSNEKPMIWSIPENRSTKMTGILNLPVAADDHAAPNGAANVNGMVRIPAERGEVP
jgi:hypothetical protein